MKNHDLGDEEEQEQEEEEGDDLDHETELRIVKDGVSSSPTSPPHVICFAEKGHNAESDNNHNQLMMIEKPGPVSLSLMMTSRQLTQKFLERVE